MYIYDNKNDGRLFWFQKTIAAQLDYQGESHKKLKQNILDMTDSSRKERICRRKKKICDD